LPARFPGIATDVTLTHGVDVPWRDIVAVTQAEDTPDLVAFGLKDRYTGEGVPPGAVNTTLFFHFNAVDRSLTQEEVNQRTAALAEVLTARFGWRG